MKIVSSPVKISVLNDMAKNMFGNLVKAVVDVEKKIMVVDGELHSDEEALLLENGSEQKNLWGINIYPEKEGDRIEFDSIINIRPAQGNRSLSVENQEIKNKILDIVNSLIEN